MNTNNGIDWIGYTFLREGRVGKPDVKYPPGFSTRGFQRERGVLGYPIVWEFDDGRLECMHPEHPEMGTHVVYTGQTLAYIYYKYGMTALDVLKFYQHLGRIARLDICVDVFDSKMSFDHLLRLATKGKAVTKAKTVRRVQDTATHGDTLYVGSETSDKRCRIYDKAAEQGLDFLKWTRVELQCRNKVAQVVEYHISSNEYTPETIPAVIKGFIDFPDYPTWRKAMSGETHQVVVPRTRPEGCRQWLQEQVLPALAKEVARPDGKGWWMWFWSAVEEQAEAIRESYFEKPDYDDIPF